MKYKLGIIGLGKMARCLVQGLLKSQTYSKTEICFSTQHAESAERVEKELGLKFVPNEKLVAESEVVLFSIKPQNFQEALLPLKTAWNKNSTLISILAGVSTEELELVLGSSAKVIRAMPNTPAHVGQAMTAICSGKFAKEADQKVACKIFDAVGKTLVVDEKHFEAVTGLSGCGPAYAYLMVEALIDGGIKVGLPRELATTLASQTVMGAAKMILETGRHPASLRDEVTTPAGCTIDGLLELEEGNVRISFIKAIVKSTARARKLNRK